MCGCDKNYLISSCSLDNQTDHVRVCLNFCVVINPHISIVVLLCARSQVLISFTTASPQALGRPSLISRQYCRKETPSVPSFPPVPTVAWAAGPSQSMLSLPTVSHLKMKASLVLSHFSPLLNALWWLMFSRVELGGTSHDVKELKS